MSTLPSVAAGPTKTVSLGVTAFTVAATLLLGHLALAAADASIISIVGDDVGLGSPFNRFFVAQWITMIVPFVLGLIATVKRRGRRWGIGAMLVSVFDPVIVLVLLFTFFSLWQLVYPLLPGYQGGHV